MILYPQRMPNRSCRWSNLKNWFVFVVTTTAIISSLSLAASTENLQAAGENSSNISPTYLAHFEANSNVQSPRTNLPYPVSRQQQPLTFVPYHSFSASDSVSAQSNPDSLRLFDHPALQYRHLDREPEAQRRTLRANHHRHLAKRQQQQASLTTPAWTFPEPFDSSLGTEFDSETCEPFITEFLKNTAFRECHPISLLLTTSQGFYRAGRALNNFSTVANQSDSADSSVMPMEKVIDASCKVDPDQCQALFDQLSSNIKSSSFGCGKDLEKRNSLALQALAGLSSYRLMREVACLTTRETPTPAKILAASPVTNLTSQHTSLGAVTTNSSAQSAEPSVKYCFINAMSSPTPDDLYYYYLPLGTSLPSGTHPSCNECTKSIMKLYALSISSNDLTLRDSYPSARTMTNSRCGPGFAPMPLKDANRLVSDAIRRIPCTPSHVQAWVLTAYLIVYLVQTSVI